MLMATSFGLTDEDQIEAQAARCAALHNSGAIDLLLLVEGSAIQGLDASRLFLGAHFFGLALPTIEGSTNRIMTCVRALVAHAGSDLAGTQPNAAFRRWCGKHPQQALEIITAAQKGDKLAAAHLTFALEAMETRAAAREIALRCTDKRRLYAITALGRMRDNDSQSRAETLRVFGEILDAGADDTTCAHLLEATLSIVVNSVESEASRASSLIRRIVHDAREQTLHQVSHAIWAYREAMRDAEIVKTLLSELMRVNPGNTGTLAQLDHALGTLLEISPVDVCVDFLAHLLSSPANELSLESFPIFMSALTRGPEDRLNRAVIRWLAQGAPRICGSLSTALRVQDLSGRVLRICAKELEFSGDMLVFIARKAFGWLFMLPTTAASILVSMLRVRNPGAAPHLKGLLAELLVSYAGVRSYLDGLGSDDVAKGSVDEVLAEDTKYVNILRAVPELVELQPSERRRRVQMIRQRQEMADARRSADKASILRSIARRSVLLHGKRALTYTREKGGEMKPLEMELKSMGFSLEIPRMQVIDPVGIDMALRVLRAEKHES